MKGKALFVSAIEVVVALFGAFGSFLLKILPEQVSGKEFIYTGAQVICVILFLLIKFLFLKNMRPRFWNWVVGIGFLVSLCSITGFYIHSKNTLKTVGYSNFRAVSGDLSAEAKETCNASPYKDNPIHHSISCEDGLLSEASTQDLAWIYTPQSVESNLNLFVILYVALALSISITIFSLIELTASTANAN